MHHDCSNRHHQDKRHSTSHHTCYIAAVFRYCNCKDLENGYWPFKTPGPCRYLTMVWWLLTLVQNPPRDFPETVPQTGDNVGKYQYRDAKFWTCGFFPGNVYCLLERSMKYPQAFLTSGPNLAAREQLRNSLLGVCRAWSEPLHDMAYRTDTHDIGFIIQPALRRDFELTGNMRSYKSILTAAESLASRFSKKTNAIRSWDTFINNGHNFNDKEKCFLLIIDSMCSKTRMVKTFSCINSY